MLAMYPAANVGVVKIVAIQNAMIDLFLDFHVGEFPKGAAQVQYVAPEVPLPQGFNIV